MTPPMADSPDSPRVEPPDGGARGPAVSIRMALALAVAAIAVVVLVVALSTNHEPGPSTPLSERELSAEAFLGSIGVVVHLNYVDTAYGRQADVIARLRELGREPHPRRHALAGGAAGHRPARREPGGNPGHAGHR